MTSVYQTRGKKPTWLRDFQNYFRYLVPFHPVCCIIFTMIRLEMTDNDQGQRLDRFLRKYFRQAPLSRIYSLVRKDLRLNGKRATPETMLAMGDVLTLSISDEEALSYRKETKVATPLRQFEIIYEDLGLLAVSKPFGLLTHGDKLEKRNTLANQVQGYLASKGQYNPGQREAFTPSPVNRLDRNTTGLVLFGKDAQTLRTLNKMIRDRDGIEKYYWTIVCGQLNHPLTLVDELSKDRERNLTEVGTGDSSGGKVSECRVKPLRYNNRYSLVEVQLITGRSHQIRAQLAAAGFPIIGDTKYGNTKVNQYLLKKLGLTTQLLHAYKLVLNGKTFLASPPEQFQRILGELIHEE